MKIERMKVKLSLDHESAKRYAWELKTLFDVDIETNQGDVLNVNYYFNIQYIGRIVECFDAIIKMVDEGIVVDADIKEVNEAGCLIQEVLKRIESFKGKVS